MKKTLLINSLDVTHQDAALDEALTESFPASDPVAVSFPHAVDLAPGKDGKNREIELKLLIDAEHVNQFIRHMPLGKYVIGKSCSEEITSTYYDTPDFRLKRHGVSLRLRHSDCGWVQTLKSIDTTSAGLHRRGEWESPVDGPVFDFRALRRLMGAHKRWNKLLSNKVPLDVIFVTNVKRTLWNLQLPTGDKIELVIDQGSITHDELQEPICEIEMELKSGEPTHLFHLSLIHI